MKTAKVKESHKTLFYSKIIPGIDISSYLDRIIKYTKIESSTLILIFIYLDRICEKASIQMTKNNIHRLLLSSVIVAIKINEDDFYSNAFYAKVGGVSLQEINTLEDEFIRLIKFDLWTDFGLFNKYKVYLSKYDKE